MTELPHPLEVEEDVDMARADADAERIRVALEQDRTIDITTVGRSSGLPRRIETWFHRVDGRFYLTGSPGRRDWYANLLAHPTFTFHLKQSASADLPAQAKPISDPAERRRIFTAILNDLQQSDHFDGWLSGSPLIEVQFTDLELSRK